MILVGDSTMAAGTGYGDALCGLFLWQVECVNLARGGRSTKTYRTDGTWDRVTTLMRDRLPRPRRRHLGASDGAPARPL